MSPAPWFFVPSTLALTVSLACGLAALCKNARLQHHLLELSHDPSFSGMAALANKLLLVVEQSSCGELNMWSRHDRVVGDCGRTQGGNRYALSLTRAGQGRRQLFPGQSAFGAAFARVGRELQDTQVNRVTPKRTRGW